MAWIPNKRTCLFALLLAVSATRVRADDGYKVWLEYTRITDPAAAALYRNQLSCMFFPAPSDQLRIARTELLTGLDKMLGSLPRQTDSLPADSVRGPRNSRASPGKPMLIVGTPATLTSLALSVPDSIGSEGYLIRTCIIRRQKCILVTANTVAGIPQIAADWLKMTFTDDTALVGAISNLMLQSRENAVNYMTPLGLAHIMGESTHYGPGPWVSGASRPDWNATYYHKADSLGIGFDRTATGSHALSQYSPAVQHHWQSVSTCPEQLLLWFHHVPWTYKMRSGRSLWNELVYRYYTGVDSAKNMGSVWNTMQGKIDPERFTGVQQRLRVQLAEATVWRDACVKYFQSFSRMPVDAALPKPEHRLPYYKALKYYYVPGIGVIINSLIKVNLYA